MDTAALIIIEEPEPEPPAEPSNGFVSMRGRFKSGGDVEAATRVIMKTFSRFQNHSRDEVIRQAAERGISAEYTEAAICRLIQQKIMHARPNNCVVLW